MIFVKGDQVILFPLLSFFTLLSKKLAYFQSQIEKLLQPRVQRKLRAKREREREIGLADWNEDHTPRSLNVPFAQRLAR